MSGDGRRTLLSLLETEEPAHLGPTRRVGTLDEAALRARVREAFAVSALSEVQQLMLALLLLWHDHLDASHTISQGIANPGGSFIHAVMHRREPDYWNSKYWWRQTGRHPALDALGGGAADYLRSADGGHLVKSVVRDGVWQPGAFVDTCESVADRPAGDPSVRLLRELQRIESRVMLDHLLDSWKPRPVRN
jgi:hypothetical protein